MRIEPPVSEPSDPGASPAATAAPEPEDEPPVTRCTLESHGLRVAQECAYSPAGPYANSCMLSLPSTTAPAPARRATTVASRAGTESARIFEPPVVRIPSVELRSFRPRVTA